MADYSFASDNTAGACPEAIEAIVAHNAGFTSGYGTDHVTARAADLVRGMLDADADVRFVASGTAANAVSCAALCRPFEAVIAHKHAHICTDETGAPGLFGHGLGLIPLEGASGKMDPAALQAALTQPDVSYRQSPAALSLTNATEYGTVYTVEEVRTLTAIARAAGLAVHLDGARLANAAAALGVPLRAITTDVGVDAVSFGGTKNGMVFGEAVVLLAPELADGFAWIRKQSMQLASKGRFLAAQLVALLEDDLWLRSAAHANAMGARLAAAVGDIPGVRLTQATQANVVFAVLDPAVTVRLQETFPFYVWDEATGEVRWMCSWDTTPEEVDAFAGAVRALTGSSAGTQRAASSATPDSTGIAAAATNHHV